VAACCVALASGLALAQEPAPQTASSAVRLIPALTPVHIEIVDAVGSAISKPDSHFVIRLADPIMLNGKELVPAGAKGEGEVVHAKKSTISGGPGELILAARWLDVNGHQLKLRSLHFAQNGQSAIKNVNRMMMASAATVPAAAVIGWFVTGKEVVIPSGTIAEAKVAADFTIEP
jgi:hypothetical protein